MRAGLFEYHASKEDEMVNWVVSESRNVRVFGGWLVTWFNEDVLRPRC